VEDRPRSADSAVAPDEDSAQWVAGLTASGSEQDACIARLHAVLTKAARAEAGRRTGLNGIAGQELQDLADQAAGDALVSILRKVTEFRGESKFTTWAYKFVVFEVANKFGRHAWRRQGVHWDEDSWERLPSRLGTDPADVSECREMISAVREAVDHALTPHQRRIFVAIVVNATPLDVLVAEMQTNRNAIYKIMFDARRKLRQHLVTQGHLVRKDGSSS
jgi:RNA polymerase sigma-70 factor (ECF subfamily)